MIKKTISQLKVNLIIFILLLIIVVYFMFRDNLKKRKCFDAKMKNYDKHVYIKLINIINKILSENNIDWIPISGNLLAIYRHKSLFIPWDDDYDIVIKNSQIDEALKILKKELPNYNANLVYSKNFDGGDLYKISFIENKSKYKIKTYKKYPYTWPFIDIFINCDYSETPLSAHNLNDSEYPLITMTINDLELKVPSRGCRSYESFKKKEYLDICEDQTWSHYYEEDIPCIGEKKKLCKNI